MEKRAFYLIHQNPARFNINTTHSVSDRDHKKVCNTEIQKVT